MGSLEETFYFKEGSMYCENLKIEDLVQQLPEKVNETLIHGKCYRIEVPTSPFYVYSAEALGRNVRNYLEGMREKKVNGILGYAVKANGNLKILEELKSEGVEMLITVSGYEILRGLHAGFQAKNIIFNGNGKQRWEIKLALELGVILNVDSTFDAKQILEIASREFPHNQVLVLLRVRPPPLKCTVDVHPYVNTSGDSKFGFDTSDMSEILEILQEHEKIKVYGIHCHLGSCIYDPRVYEYIARFLTDLSATLAKSEIHVKLLDIGGGIGINYHGTIPGFQPTGFTTPQIPPTSSSPSSTLSSPQSFFETEGKKEKVEESKSLASLSHFMEPMAKLLPSHIPVLLEPGRSLVGNTGVLVTKVLGRKNGERKNFAVVDGAMTDLIRPALYGSHHRIYPCRYSPDSEWRKFDVVGPVCESGDFLGKDVLLPVENYFGEDEYVTVMDCGAYASSMSSNYNLRPRGMEILVDGTKWTCIRERETYNQLTSSYDVGLHAN